MSNVFKIVFPVINTQTKEITHDLETMTDSSSNTVIKTHNHNEITIEEVANSNIWHLVHLLDQPSEVNMVWRELVSFV